MTLRKYFRKKVLNGKKLLGSFSKDNKKFAFKVVFLAKFPTYQSDGSLEDLLFVTGSKEKFKR